MIVVYQDILTLQMEDVQLVIAVNRDRQIWFVILSLASVHVDLVL